MSTRLLSTRLFELGLPHFAGLNLGEVMEAQASIQAGDFTGLARMMNSFGKMGEMHTIRRLAALWNASEIELKLAENDETVMKELESRAADLPFMEAFQAAMLFQGALFESLGVTPTSSATVDAPIPKKKKAPASPSAV
jgi:hypothetical protein